MAKTKFFIGKYDCKLDEKGRLVFPSDLKAQLAAFEETSLIVRKDIQMKCLNLYTQDSWEKEADRIKSLLDLFNPEDNEMWIDFVQGRELVTPDEKSGRILIPRHLLEEVDAIKEMVFVGTDSIIKLWAKEEYDRIKAKKNDNKLASTLAERSRNRNKE